jgi:hypothetical protein
VDEAIENLVEPETVLCLAVLVKITNLASVKNLTLPAQRGERAQVRVHCRIHQASVVVVALYISWSIEPVDSQRLHALGWIIVGMYEFHNSTEIVRLAGRLAHKVQLV